MKFFYPNSSIIIIMSSITDIINNLIEFFNTKNIPFIIGGDYAIQKLCEMKSITYDYEINNLDIFYLANTPITNEYIYEYHRVQSTPHNSMFYITPNGFQINLTMCRSHSMRYISHNHMKLMLPTRMLSYVNEDINRNLDKLLILEELIDMFNNSQTNYIYRNNNQPEEYQPSQQFEPLARRLFVS